MKCIFSIVEHYRNPIYATHIAFTFAWFRFFSQLIHHIISYSLLAFPSHTKMRSPVSLLLNEELFPKKSEGFMIFKNPKKSWNPKKISGIHKIQKKKQKSTKFSKNCMKMNEFYASAGKGVTKKIGKNLLLLYNRWKLYHKDHESHNHTR